MNLGSNLVVFCDISFEFVLFFCISLDIYCSLQVFDQTSKTIFFSLLANFNIYFFIDRDQTKAEMF